MKLPSVNSKSWRPHAQGKWCPPSQTPWFPLLIDLLGGLYSRLGLGLDRVRWEGLPELAAHLAEAPAMRNILAFRHCGDADPQALFWALNSLGRRAYRTAGLKKRPRFLFLAGAEIALWGGPVTAWALEKGGTLSLAHGTLGRQALDWLRKNLASREEFLLLAPEGQITYELRGPIVMDPGVASMAEWAQDGESRAVQILPLRLRYTCPRETWWRWKRFMDRLEKTVGLAPEQEASRRDAVKGGSESASDGSRAHARLLRLWVHLLELGENYYSHNHGLEFPTLDKDDAGGEARMDCSPSGGTPAEAAPAVVGSIPVQRRSPSELSLRCQRLVRRALELACRSRGWEAGPDSRQEILRLRADNLRILLEGRGKGPLERKMRERACQEAFWTNRHQELADLLNNLDPDRLPPEPDLDQAVETALNLADLAGRLAGGTVGDRPRYFRRELVITLGRPIAVKARFGAAESGGEKQSRREWGRKLLDALARELRGGQ